MKMEGKKMKMMDDDDDDDDDNDEEDVRLYLRIEPPSSRRRPSRVRASKTHCCGRGSPVVVGLCSTRQPGFRAHGPS